MKVPITLIMLLLISVGAFVYYEDGLFPGAPAASEEQVTEEESDVDDAVFCIQVITPARNPETGEIQEFPTPCDVPEGWEEIEPEGLDVDIQTI